MTNNHAVHGLWCAMLTPLDRDGGVDPARFARHAHWLLAQGIDGVAPFGTTGEGQSFSIGGTHRRARRAARRGVAARPDRRRHRRRSTDRHHRAHATRRRSPGAPAAWCCRPSSSTTSPTTACTRGTHGSSRRSPIRACGFFSITYPRCPARRSRSTSWRGSQRRSPASSPASRTAPETGRTHRHCSRACRSSRSSSATSPICRVSFAPAAPGRSAASRTSFPRSSVR